MKMNWKCIAAAMLCASAVQAGNGGDAWSRAEVPSPADKPLAGKTTAGKALSDNPGITQHPTDRKNRVRHTIPPAHIKRM